MHVSCKAITTILAGSPWRVSLYLDDRASREQYAALAATVPGRAGGTTRRNFAAAIGTVHAVWRARIELSHVPRRRSIRADSYLIVHAATPAAASALVAYGIPGFDQPGQEVVARRVPRRRRPAQLGRARAVRLCHRLRRQLPRLMRGLA
jgi:Protein of unknown function (DUF1326)